MKLKVINNKNIAILGAGLTGKAMADWFLENNNRVYIFDDNYNDNISNYILKHEYKNNISFISSPKYQFNFDFFDFVLLSPSFKLDKKYIHSSCNYSNFYTELDYFYPYLKDKTIFSVTGTNGKTSTVKVLAELLEKNNKKVFLGGNIGVPLVNALRGDYDTIVLELSSFQLFYTQKFRSDYSILLNLSPDHLTWHKDYEEYALAKLKLVDLTTKKSFVHDSFEDFIKKSQNLELFNLNTELDIDKTQLNSNKLPFWVNFIPMIKIMKSLGMYNNDIIQVINDIDWVKYRLTEKKINKNLFINDSKSTNIDSTIFAASNYKDAILILGGDDKKLDYSVFVDLLKDKKLKQIIVFGGLKDKLYEILKSDFNILKFEDLRKVFVYLKQNIKNDKILFSPGSSSFDLYQNYVKRGEHFDELVGEFFE